MPGQLCWIPKIGGSGQLALHLRLQPYQPWKPHTAFPGFCVPDYPVPGGSRGWATSQKLLQSGWTFISTRQAQSSFETSSKAA